MLLHPCRRPSPIVTVKGIGKPAAKRVSLFRLASSFPPAPTSCRSHGGPCGLRIKMSSAERAGQSAVFLCRPDRTTMPRSQRGGYGMAKSSNAAKPLSSICLSLLWLAVLKRPSRCGRGRKAGDVSDPPQNRGVMRSRVAVSCGIPLLGPMGSLTSSFIPAGRLVKTPLSPRASSCRIGPRRQGFASPLRALDGSGPIRKTRCLRGERGGAGRGARGRASA